MGKQINIQPMEKKDLLWLTVIFFCYWLAYPIMFIKISGFEYIVSAAIVSMVTYFFFIRKHHFVLGFAFPIIFIFFGLFFLEILARAGLLTIFNQEWGLILPASIFLQGTLPVTYVVLILITWIHSLVDRIKH